MRALLSALEERLEHPTARGLVAAVTLAIADGVLVPGTKLPPIRTIATELALSPTTVSSAWALLARSGTVRTAGRHGTTVLDVTGAGVGRYRRALAQPAPLAQDLSTGVPDQDLLPTLGVVLSQVDRAGTPNSYLQDPVLPELAELLRADWPYPPPRLAVVDGAMDALDLVTRTALRPGDRVVVEHPCFPPVVDLLEALSVEIVGVPVDDEGLDPDAFAQALQRPVAAVVLQPRGQNPTGVTTTRRRARRLAELVGLGETLVIEDDSAHGLSPTPALSLGEWLPEQSVHIRSFSKSYGPDLRLAAMSGPPELMRAVDRRRHLGQGWSSRLLQRILVGLLTEPAAVAQVERAQQEYARRRRLLRDALAARSVSVGGTEGLNMWIPVEDETAAVVRLASQGIGVSAGSPFAALPTPQGHVRLTCGLVVEGHDDLAQRIADAAQTVGWGARAR
ncbi:PLP-dependent aminotransferase family protein [Nocardioides dokdonensis]|uniref:aminotransferase-like domain-containing protein n=1 Tax=Nocardioides dokdonensis TaxID=450734 RepID=UPI0009FBD31F|nr:PLP-dependent aminotransferase family protein [Nocardioides dokdonensis]